MAPRNPDRTAVSSSGSHSADRKRIFPMKILDTYHIRFTRRGEEQVRQFQAGDPGNAFAKCVKKFPVCILLGGWREGRLSKKGGEICRLTYAPPSTAQIVAESGPKAEQTTFEFFFSCREEPAANRGISLRTNHTCRMQPQIRRN
jgi:hypothetical protein